MFWAGFENLCKGIGKSPTSVLEEIGMSSSLIPKWKSGSIPRNSSLKLIAEYFGFPVNNDVINSLRNGTAKIEKDSKIADYVDMDNPFKKKAPSVSDEAMRIAKGYDELDSFGRKQMRSVLRNEQSRMEEQAEIMPQEEEPKIIPLYLSPAAAGYASPIMGDDYEPLELSKSDPQGAEFAVRIQGDSMEPYIKDGSYVYVNNDPLADGDIGIFAVDGETICKQYHFDRMMKITYLLSLNRKRADADVIITPSSGRSLVCLGRVIINRRLPLAGLE